MPFGKKSQIWFNNLSISDYDYFSILCNNTENKNIFIATDEQTNKKFNYLFVLYTKDNNSALLLTECFISILEKDRCLLSYKKPTTFSWVDDCEKICKNEVLKIIRKEKISTFLYENKNK